MALSFRKLEVLSGVSEAGSFAGAARHLHLTQPGVSQLIRGLEDEFGVVLFTRHKGRLRATPFCDRLCDAADRVILEYRAVEQMLHRHGTLAQGELSIGLGNAMPGMSVVAAFNKTYPNVGLRVSTGSHDKIMRDVINHRLDVGILPEIPDDRRFRRKVLTTNHVVAIVGLDHPFARRDSISCAALLGQPLIFRSEGSSTQKVVDRYFRRNGADPAPFLILDTRDGVYEAVVNGMGVGFVWQTATGRNRDVRQLTLEGGGTQSAEVVFAPADREMETIGALFDMIDVLRGSTAQGRTFTT